MKQFYSVMLVWLMSLVFFPCIFCKAETKVPCFIFSGNAEQVHCIDLATLNRITFGENSMIVSSSKDSGAQSIELLYSLYHHLEIGEGTPTDVDSSVEVISADSNARLYFDANSKLLYLQTSSASQFQVGIFNISGTLLLTTELYNGDAVTLESLSSGVYIVVASDSKTKISLKFILK